MDKKIFIITGLSGAGKSTALRVFEDLRYFAIDGLPVVLAPEMSELLDRKAMRHFRGMAMGMDLRQNDFLENFTYSLEKLRTRFETRIIFLEAADHALTKRYAATRRPHPLEAEGLDLSGAIEKEKTLLLPVRNMASLVIDSSDYSIHDLRRIIQKHLRDEAFPSLRINIISFGFKYGLPQDMDFLFDLRFLDNPYFNEELRHLSGLDTQVVDYVFGHETARTMRSKIIDLMLFTLQQMEIEGRYRVTIAFGCTGGRHRSVAMAENIGKSLKQAGYAVTVSHRNLNEDIKEGTNAG